jgi:hypothetical protein
MKHRISTTNPCSHWSAWRTTSMRELSSKPRYAKSRIMRTPLSCAENLSFFQKKLCKECQRHPAPVNQFVTGKSAHPGQEGIQLLRVGLTP